jgi:hypothetical protein
VARFLRTETNSSRGHSRLIPPAVVNPVPETRLPDGIQGTLAPLSNWRRVYSHSFLRPPAVVSVTSALAAPVSVTLAPQRRGKPKSRLLPVPAAFRPVGQLHVHLVSLVPPAQRSRLATHPRLTQVVYEGKTYLPLRGYLFPLLGRVPAVRSRLSPPSVVAAAPVAKAEYDLRTTLAYQSRGKPKSRLSPPVRQTALAVPSTVTLFPLLGRVPAVHSRLRPPENPPQKPIGVFVAHLTYSRRGRPKSRLSLPAWTRSFGRVKTTLAPQRRGKPKSRLSPPAIQTYLAQPSSVTLFPLTNRVPTVHSRLLPIPPVSAAVVFYARPIDVELTYSRRGAPRSVLAQVIYDAAIYEPIRGYLIKNKVPPVRSRLAPPTAVLPPIAFGGPRVKLVVPRSRNPKVVARLAPPTVITPIAVLAAITTTFAPSHRSRIVLSRLRPPTVVFPTITYGGPRVKLVAPRSRNPAVISRLRPPTLAAALTYADTTIDVTLAPSHRGVTKSRLRPPTVVAPVLARAIDVTLAPQRRGKPKSRLLPVPAAFRPVGQLNVTLAYSLRGKPKSRLRPPTVVFPFFARKTQVTLARIRPVPTTHRLGPPTDIVDQADVGQLRIHLAYSRRGAPRSVLHPPVPPETFRGLQLHLAPSTRGKPRSFFVPVPIAYLAVELSGPETTLVRIRPARTMWNLGPMGLPAVVYAPISTSLAYSRRGKAKSKLPQASLYQPRPKAEYDLKVTLAPQRRGQPKSKLRPPTRVNAATPYFRELPVTLAPQRRGKAKSRLFPPTVLRAFTVRPVDVTLAPQKRGRPRSRLLGVIYAARVYAPITTTLAPSRRLVAKSVLRPPVVVTQREVVTERLVRFVRIRPVPTTSFLRPPTVVRQPEIDYSFLRVTLVRIRPVPVHSLLARKATVFITPGGGDCEIGDFPVGEVECGDDSSYGGDVDGGDSPVSGVSGGDTGRDGVYLSGGDSASGSVHGGDERND